METGVIDTATTEIDLIKTIFTVGILLFAAKHFSELFDRIKQPQVVGYLLAGIIFGPFALGGFIVFDGVPLIVVNETIRQLGEISAIVILFIAGMEITPKEFLKRGAPAFTLGTLSVIIPFVFGYLLFTFFFDFSQLDVLLISTALTATSIAITVRVLQEMGKMDSEEGRTIFGAAIIDDVLAIAILSVVTSMVEVGIGETNSFDIMFMVIQTLGFYVALMIGSVFLIPRFLKSEKLWRPHGSLEGIITAAFFIAAGIAAIIGLSPIVGSFVVGMAVARSGLIEKVEPYAEKLGFFFAPLFFVIIGAQVDLRGIDLFILYGAGVMIAIAVISKLIGTGLPAFIFLKDKQKSMRVGIGMISRGEVGLIVAQVGITAGVLSSNIYTMIVIMAAVTTIITPIWLKKSYGKRNQ